MKKRHIIYLCVLGLLLLSFIPLLAPVRPYIQLPGELVVRFETPILGIPGITNTVIATVLTFIIVNVLALSLRARSRTAGEVPTGFYNFFEMLVEMLYGYVENMAGSKWAKTFFPFFMTFILWIVVANWMELVPGVDSIGKWETMGEVAGHKAEAAAKADAAAAGETLSKEELHHIFVEAEEIALEENVGDLRRGIFLVSARSEAVTNSVGERVSPEDADYTLVPYIRAAATDLNFTLAVALISVVMTQYYGMKAQGLSYWKKFFNWPADKIAKNPLGILDPVVGLLEFVSEVFKIVSFSFRLLGNIFAGQVLLFVIGALLPFGNILFWHLEFAVGALQAVVFALLTLTFMNSAIHAAHH